MLMVTHDVDEAIALADRVLVMRDGRIASDRPVELDIEHRAHGRERDRLRLDLLSELGLTPSAS
jgi:sulfonate transport system ATP-binding protein